MSLVSLITDFKTKIFGTDKPKIAKFTPKIDNEFVPDLEAGEGGFYRRLKQRQQELELYSKPKDWDLEKCNKSIICGEVAIDIHAYEKCKIIENYISFIDSIGCFTSNIFRAEAEDLQHNEYNLSNHIVIDILSNNSIDISENFYNSNIM